MNIVNYLRGQNGVIDELVTLRAKRGVLKVEYGQRVRTPRWSEEYSAAKLDNLSRDIESLDEEEQRLLERLQAMKEEPKYVAARDAKLVELHEKLSVLRSEYDACKVSYDTKRQAAAFALLDGGDALELAGELHAIEERGKRLAGAIECIISALHVGSV